MRELEFQKRWEVRRNDDNDPDSSFNDSISSDGSLIRKQKLVSRLVSLGDDETSEVSRLKQDHENTGKASQIKVGKVTKRKTGNKRSKKMKDSPEEVDLQKGDTSAHDHAPLDGLKNFVDSLLKDLKITRESLLKWMIDEVQQLVGDLRGKPDQCDDKVQLKKRKETKKVKDQHETTLVESTQSHRSSNSEKCIQVQCHADSQQQNNFQEKNKQQVLIRDGEHNNKQHRNDFGYGMDRSLVRFPTGITASGSTDYLNALGDQLSFGQFVELITSSKRKVDSLSVAAVKPNHQTSGADQNVQVQSNTTAVLAIEAQKAKCGSLKRSVKVKKTIDLDHHHQVPEYQDARGQAVRIPGASTNGEKLGSSVQNFRSSPFGQPPWSMYPMFPTEQIAANQGPNASLYNNVLPRAGETKSCMNSERANQMLEPGSNQGSFSVIPPEETIRRFALMGSRNMDCINQKSIPTSGIGTGFPFPLHQGIDFGLSISNPRQFNPEYPRQSNPQNLSQETSKPLDLKMNEGAAKCSGGSYNLSEHITANNHNGNPTYKSDGRFLSYQIQNHKDGHLFL